MTDPAPYPVRTASVVLPARSPSGAHVSVPTAIWYPLRASGARLPLVVFSPGYQIPPTAYGPLTAAWASAGYIVAEPTYPDTAPGSPPIESDMVNHPSELEQVVSDVLDASAHADLPIPDAVDPTRVAVAGQSDGGDVTLAAAANSCCRDSRIKAVIILSGAESALFSGTWFPAGSPPLMVVQGTADIVNLPACSEEIYDASPAPRYYLDLLGATHLSAYTEPGPELSAVATATTAFLDGYVKSSPSRIAALTDPGRRAAPSHLTSGAATVPIAGSCPGAP